MRHPTDHRLWNRVVVGAVPVLFMAMGGCNEVDVPVQQQIAEADWRAGRAALARYDCGVCHAIPGVQGARGAVGPPLDGFGSRAYIAGFIPNQPQWLTAWLQNPPALAPNTVMPNMGVSSNDARDMAAYLYRLR